MLQRGFTGAFDKKPDRVAFAKSLGNAASTGADLQPRKNLLKKLLSVICDVRPGEGLGALILTINLFTLLGAYYLLKTVRESRILVEGGAEVKAYSSAAQAILLLGVVPLCGCIATHLNRNRLLRWTTLFFSSNLLIFYFVGQAGIRMYYIWVGIFNVFTVARLWLLRQTSFLRSKAKDSFRYSELERRLERSQGRGLQDD
jgi:AAA family ATP:ADP antiporter